MIEFSEVAWWCQTCITCFVGLTSFRALLYKTGTFLYLCLYHQMANKATASCGSSLICCIQPSSYGSGCLVACENSKECGSVDLFRAFWCLGITLLFIIIVQLIKYIV